MRLLLISSNIEANENITTAFENNGFEIILVSSLTEAQDILLHQWIPLILINGDDNTINAIELYSEIQDSILLLDRIILLTLPIRNNLKIKYADLQIFDDIIHSPIDGDLLDFKIRSIKSRILTSIQFSTITQLIPDEDKKREPHCSSLVKHLAEMLNVKYALISQRQNLSEWRTEVLSFWDNGNWGKTFDYDLQGAPCEAVFRDGPQWYGSDIQQRFPKDGALHKLGIQFYYGAPLKNHSGEVIGHLCVLHDKPVAFDPRLSEAVRIYAHLASREILLSQYEDSQTQFQKSLQFIVNNMECGIFLEDENQIIRLMNQQFCDMFQLNVAPNDFVGSNAIQCIENLQSKMQDRERFLVRIHEIRQVQDPVTCEEWFMKNDRILHLDVIPIQEDQSNHGILWLFRDATKQKSAEIELSNAQEQEIEIGSKIQKTLLLGVTPNDIPALNVAALTIPSKRIDGDFYDFFHVDETRLDVLVGDVMGKGVAAALLGAALKSHFQRAMRKLLAAQAGGWPEPRQIVSLVHRAMTEQLIDLESFFTLFYMRFDVKQSECIYLDCGHMPTIWFQRNNQTCRLLNGDNLPLGVTELEKFEQRTISFDAGDFFVLYSDGITEAPSPAGELFGIERLQKLIQENHELSPNQLMQKLHQNLTAYTQSPHFSDDLTCVIVKITEKGISAPCRKKSARFKSKMSELQKAREFITQFHDEQNARTNFCSLQKLILAVNEAAANIIQHAYEGNEDFHWEMRVEEFYDRWVVSLLHDGISFDPDQAPKPAFDGSRSSGFGIYIIKESVDEVVYGRHEDGRRLIQLMKRFQSLKGKHQ